jgi:hypothetical protein
MAWHDSRFVLETSRPRQVRAVSSMRRSAAGSTNASLTGSTVGGSTEQELRGGVGDGGVTEHWFNRRWRVGCRDVHLAPDHGWHVNGPPRRPGRRRGDPSLHQRTGRTRHAAAGAGDTAGRGRLGKVPEDHHRHDRGARVDGGLEHCRGRNGDGTCPQPVVPSGKTATTCPFRMADAVAAIVSGRSRGRDRSM